MNNIIPVQVRVGFRNLIKDVNGNVQVNWFNGTIKVITEDDCVFLAQNMSIALINIMTLYQLNEDHIDTIKLEYARYKFE